MRNKSVGVKAIFEEEFRFYSSQPSPAREERVLDGSKVWLLLSVSSRAIALLAFRQASL